VSSTDWPCKSETERQRVYKNAGVCVLQYQPGSVAGVCLGACLGVSAATCSGIPVNASGHKTNVHLDSLEDFMAGQVDLDLVKRVTLKTKLIDITERCLHKVDTDYGLYSLATHNCQTFCDEMKGRPTGKR